MKKDYKIAVAGTGARDIIWLTLMVSTVAASPVRDLKAAAWR